MAAANTMRDPRNWIDRAIGYFSPKAGNQRLRYRMASEILRGYDAARTGRRWDNLIASGTDANSALDGDLQRLRDRTREAVRNNPLAGRLRDLVAGGAVGAGINPQADTGRPELNQAIDQTFSRWCEECDADGQLDFFGIQRLVADEIFEAGGVLTRRRIRLAGDGWHVPLKLQVMEADHVDLAQTKNNSGGVTVQGVEFDALGQRAGYWLYPQHPGALVVSLRDSLQSKFVPASEISHAYRKTRAGQVHGAPALSNVLGLLNDMHEFNDAVIMGVKVAACYGLFVEQSDDGGVVGAATTVDENGNRTETLRPGGILYGRPGEKPHAMTPSGPTNFVDYMKFEQALAATAVNCFYAQAAGDLSAVNWASFRAGDRDYRAAIEAFRWLYLEPMFLQVVWRWFIDAAYLAKRIPAVHYGVTWEPPQFLSVDPKKDAEADAADLANGALHFGQLCGRRGVNPDKQLAQSAEWMKKIDDAGLVFEWDRRKVKAGAAAAAAPDPASGQ